MDVHQQNTVRISGAGTGGRVTVAQQNVAQVREELMQLNQTVVNRGPRRETTTRADGHLRLGGPGGLTRRARKGLGVTSAAITIATFAVELVRRATGH